MKKIACLLVVVFMLVAVTPVYADVYLTKLVINEEIVPGPDDIYLTVTGILSNGSYQRITSDLLWYSSDNSIATVNSQGRLHFTGKSGPVTITVMKLNASGSKTIYVRSWPKKLEIETDLVYSDKPYPLMVKGKFSDGEERYFTYEDNLQWSTSNPYVAWVNSQGVVTFTGNPGSVRITASWGSLSDSVSVYVHDQDDDAKAAWIGVRIKEEEIPYSKDPVKLTLVAKFTDGSEEELNNYSADWSSSNPEVATVTREGEVVFTGKPGVATITVKYGGYSHKRTVTVNRFLDSIRINQSLNFTPNWEGVPLQLTATGKYNDGTETTVYSRLTWSIDNKKVAQLSSDGVLTFTGEKGKATIKVTAPGYGDTVVEDSLTVEVPEYPKAKPQRFFLDINPYNSVEPLSPKAYCLYDDGSLREVTGRSQLLSLTPGTASVYQGKIYIAPNPGPIQIRAVYQGLSDEIKGFVNNLSGNSERVQQVRIKEHGVAFSFKPVRLTALAIMGDGSIRDVTSKVSWQSSQPLVAKISKGVLTFTGRVGKAVITMQGYGFRDELTVEVTPAELQPRVESLSIIGDLTRPTNQLKAIATFNDGTVQDVTTAAVWNTSDREYAPVIQGIVMFPKGLKPATITASYGGREASVSRN